MLCYYRVNQLINLVPYRLAELTFVLLPCRLQNGTSVTTDLVWISCLRAHLKEGLRLPQLERAGLPVLTSTYESDQCTQDCWKDWVLVAGRLQAGPIAACTAFCKPMEGILFWAMHWRVIAWVLMLCCSILCTLFLLSTVTNWFLKYNLVIGVAFPLKPVNGHNWIHTEADLPSENSALQIAGAFPLC